MTSASRFYFNRLAAEWPLPPPDDTPLLRRLQEFGVRDGDRVLDIGCGTGRTSTALHRLTGRTGTVVHVDVAEEMVRIGRRRHSCGRWVCGDAMRLCFRDGCFDKILCYSTFPHFSDPQAVLAEMFRLLTPGGGLLILHDCCSRRLNEMHAHCDPVVASDRLPAAAELEGLLQRLPFCRITACEHPTLYWVSASKA